MGRRGARGRREELGVGENKGAREERRVHVGNKIVEKKKSY